MNFLFIVPFPVFSQNILPKLLLSIPPPSLLVNLITKLIEQIEAMRGELAHVHPCIHIHTVSLLLPATVNNQPKLLSQGSLLLIASRSYLCSRGPCSCNFLPSPTSPAFPSLYMDTFIFHIFRTLSHDHIFFQVLLHFFTYTYCFQFLSSYSSLSSFKSASLTSPHH